VDSGGAESGAVGADSGHFDADLKTIIDVWPTLPEDTLQAILGLVRGSEKVQNSQQKTDK
jgi:hypothetical protein